MPLNLHKIKLDTKSRQLLGNQNKFPDLRRVFREIATDAVDAAADYGLVVAKSLVPIDTFELRGTNLDNGMIRKGKQSNYSVSVYVTDDAHTGNGHTQPASTLAKILDKGVNEKGRQMLRTQNSAAIDAIITLARRTPTKGWIQLSNKLITGPFIGRYLHERMDRDYV